MPTPPRVTVLIPAFNAERFVGAAIESVLAQTFKDFELLVIDDGSTDSTATRICTFGRDARLRVVSHCKNLGRPATRNHGIDLARGEYIAFLDADDVCAPERLERQVAHLDSHRHVTGVGSWMSSIDDHGCPLTDQTYALPRDADNIACRMLFECSLAQSAITIRRSAFTAYRYDESFWIAQDYELWARMIVTCRFTNLPEPLTCYRRHAAQVSITDTKSQRMADLQIQARQLAALGIQYRDEDLIRHECVFKFKGRRPVLEQTGAPLDVDYLRWVRAWLEALFEANAQRGIYPEPAFTHMLAARWLFAVRKAARNSPWRLVAIEFINARLLRAVGLYAWQKVKMQFTVRNSDVDAA